MAGGPSAANDPPRAAGLSLPGRFLAWAGRPDSAPARFAFAFLLVFVAGGLLYLLPRWGMPVGSDVTWLYRLQVAGPALDPFVPEGVRIVGAYPMNALEACAAHYWAFGRLNCFDIVTFRWMSAAAGGSATGWIFITTVVNAASFAMVYVLLRKLDAPRALAVPLLIGTLFWPMENWLSYRISETKANVPLMIALLFALRAQGWRDRIVSAAAMALALLSKEPMLAAWPAVAGVALYGESRRAPLDVRDWRRLAAIGAPHAAAAAAVGLLWLVMSATVENPYSYAVLSTSPHPDVTTFIAAYWAAMTPGLLEGRFLLAVATPAVAIAVALAIQPSYRAATLRAFASPWLWALLAGLAASIVLHGAFYFATRRMITPDMRYVDPAFLLFAVLLGVVIARLLQGAGQRLIEALVLLLTAGVALSLTLSRFDALPLGPIALLLGGAAFAILLGLRLARLIPGDWRHALACGLVLILSAPHVDRALLAQGAERADMATYTAAIDELVDQTPPGGHVVLRFTDPFMIETAWGLQAELLFRGRTDVTMHLDVADISAYAQESGLLRYINEGFNRGRSAPPEGADAQGEVVVMTASRSGRDRSTIAQDTPSGWLGRLLTDPGAFIRERYFLGRTGYLDYRLESPAVPQADGEP